jgi:opacity protein-like surface antigen
MTTMTRIIVAMTALAILFQAAPAGAQERWAVEFRGNGIVGTHDLDMDTHQNGFGYEASVRYRFLPHLSAYAGWDWTRFKAGDAFTGPHAGHLEETGYAVGLRFEHPFREGSRTAGWLRAGGMYNHVELENKDGDVVSDSGHGLGWEAGAGLAYGLNGRWSLTPGVRYRAISRDLEVGSATIPVDLQYVAFELGIAFRF